MASPTHKLNIFSDGSFQPVEQPDNLFVILHNTVPRGTSRPQVFRPETECYYSWKFNEAWQRYAFDALAWTMYKYTPMKDTAGWIFLSEKMIPIYGDNKFIANGDGLKTGHNYITGENAGEPDPEITTLFCGGGVLRGEMQGDYLYYETMDAEKSPPSIDDVNPGSHPWLFVVATVVTTKLIDGVPQINPFPQLGGRNAGKGVYVPLCSIHRRGPQRVALWDDKYSEMRIMRWPATEPVPNPYRPEMVEK